MPLARALLTVGTRVKQQKIILLCGEQVTFGRDINNDVQLHLAPLDEPIFQMATADISRQHFRIHSRDLGYTIQDLNSTNGTSINCVGVITEQSLKSGQIIDIGGVLELNVVLSFGSLWLQRVNNMPNESYLIFRQDGFTMGNDVGNTIVVASYSPSTYKIQIFFDGTSWNLVNHQESPVQVNNNPVFYNKKILLSSSSDIILGNEIILFQIDKKN